MGKGVCGPKEKEHLRSRTFRFLSKHSEKSPERKRKKLCPGLTWTQETKHKKGLWSSNIYQKRFHFFFNLILYLIMYNIFIVLFFSSFLFLMCIYFWERAHKRECERGRGRERGRHRIGSRLQALSCQHRARCRAHTHKPWDHDLSRSQMLNWLSHPGTPAWIT